MKWFYVKKKLFPSCWRLLRQMSQPQNQKLKRMLVSGAQQFAATGVDEMGKRDLYHGSLYLRRQLVSVKSPVPRPPDSTDITTERAIQVIPVELFNALAVMTGLSDEVNLVKKFADVSQSLLMSPKATRRSFLP